MNPALLNLGALGLITWGVLKLVKRPTVAPPVIIPPVPAPKPVTPVASKPAAKSDSLVATVQARLNALGASPQLSVDGVSGPKTTAAVKQFQASHGIEPDGVVGPITLAALGIGSGANVVPTTYENIPLVMPDFTPLSTDD